MDRQESLNEICDKIYLMMDLHSTLNYIRYYDNKSDAKKMKEIINSCKRVINILKDFEFNVQEVSDTVEFKMYRMSYTIVELISIWDIKRVYNYNDICDLINILSGHLYKNKMVNENKQNKIKYRLYKEINEMIKSYDKIKNIYYYKIPLDIRIILIKKEAKNICHRDIIEFYEVGEDCKYSLLYNNYLSARRRFDKMMILDRYKYKNYFESTLDTLHRLLYNGR